MLEGWTNRIFMAEQIQDTGIQGATFVDLDGTLLRGNSLRIYMKRLPSALLRRHAVGATIASLWWMGCRLVRVTSHKRMKWHLTKIGRSHLLDEDWEDMAVAMLRRVSPMVKEYVESPKREKCRKYIATAAMEDTRCP